ncbi:GNAT family N-acetyltransferase, partial [Fulvivirga lutimaris]|uniref:GNAT family N-acetyltransferase n=1 Tax=Fulvivirga lutimaris TaxID=1819566 RepID=UPI0016247DAD|nr:N-acetyltransferase [Fulvivirga lutimaris]
MGLETKRLKLRLINQNDIDDFHKLHSIAEVDHFNTLGIPEDIEASKRILDDLLKDQEAGSYFTFNIELIEEAQFTGYIALKLGATKFQAGEVWFKLLPDFWGKGIASEALSAVLKFGFHELKLHRIEAGCAVENIASARVLEKAGMQKEGTRRQALPLKSGWSDNHEYA